MSIVEVVQQVVARFGNNELTSITAKNNNYNRNFYMGVIYQLIFATQTQITTNNVKKCMSVANEIAACLKAYIAPSNQFTDLHNALLMLDPAFVSFLMGTHLHLGADSSIRKAFVVHSQAEPKILAIIRDMAFDVKVMGQINGSARKMHTKKLAIMEMKNKMQRMKRECVEMNEGAEAVDNASDSD